MNANTLPISIQAADKGLPGCRALGRSARCLAAVGFSVASLSLTGCSSDDPQTQKIYYDGWMHPSGTSGTGYNPFSKEFWVGDGGN